MVVPLTDQVSQFLPRLVSAILLIILAIVLAVIVRAVVRRVLTAVHLDQRVGNTAQGGTSLATLISEVAFWLVILFFVPAILDALAIGGLLGPFQNMVDKLLGFLPNLLAAALILVVGIFVARLVRQILVALLGRLGLDGLGARVGFTAANRQQPLSNVIGTVVYVLILIVVITMAVNALGLTALTTPLSDMLTTFFNALPNIFAAALLLILSYVIARLVATLITGLLKGIGFDNILTRIGLTHQPAAGMRSPSEWVGYLVFIGIMLFAAIEASRLLGFAEVATLIAGVTVLLGQIVLGLIIFGIGLFLANLAFQAINDTGMQQSYWLAWAARIAILILTGAMALRQMGLAPEIINLAFGLLLGAMAVAAALAFGLGGQQVAARLLEDSVRNLRAGEAGNRPAGTLPPGPSQPMPPTPPGSVL